MPSSVKGEDGRREVCLQHLRRLLFPAASIRMKKRETEGLDMRKIDLDNWDRREIYDFFSPLA